MENVFHFISRIAGADVTKKLFGKLEADGDIIKTATAGEKGHGVIRDTVSSGYMATLEYSGFPLEVECSGTVTAGEEVATDANAKAVTVTNGAYALGRALSTGTNALVEILPYAPAQYQYGSTKRAFVALTGTAIQGGVQAWQNPEGASIVITNLLLDITTAATGAATLDVGTTATSATTASDNLIDGLDINAAANVSVQRSGSGTNGKAGQRLASGKWVTFKSASGDTTGAVMNAIVEYHLA